MPADSIRLEADAAIDRILPFQIEAADMRGRVLRMGPVLDNILAAHAYPGVIARLLGEALALTCLTGSALKDIGQLTLQARADGPVRLMVCDFRLPGEVRGYVDFDAAAVAALPPEPALPLLFGSGYLALTMEQGADAERYQGIVPLEGEDLAAAAAAYFAQSEQLPTALRLAVRHDGLSGRWLAGGLMLQHLPGDAGAPADADGWNRVAILGQSVRPDELTDPELALEALLWRLYHEEDVIVFPERSITRGCRCTQARIADVLRQFPSGQRRDLAEADGCITVNCEFCSRGFRFTPDVEPA